jgi:hypothetical protein
MFFKTNEKTLVYQQTVFKMNLNLKLIAFCSIVFFAVVGCNKQSNELLENQTMATPIVSNLIPDLIPTSNGYTTTANNTSLLFHYANAIQLMTSNATALSQMASAVVASKGYNPVFVNTLATGNANFNALLNTALRTSVTNYPNLPSSGINWNDLLQNPALDAHQWMMTQLVALGADEPILYSLDEISVFNFSKPRVIMDIEVTSGGTSGAGWQSGVQQTFTEDDALANVDRSIGVSLSVKQKNVNDRDFSEEWPHTFPKWYHHGKVNWLPTESVSNDLSVQWKTKFRWYSDWKSKTHDPLNGNNQISEFYYDNFRIFVRVKSNWDNFDAWEKHWTADEWISIH